MTPIVKTPPAESPRDDLPPPEASEELNPQLAWTPDYQAENQVLSRLPKAPADLPENILQILSDNILEFLHADSAGVSLLTTHDDRKCVYRPGSLRLRNAQAITFQERSDQQNVKNCPTYIREGITREISYSNK